MSRRPAYDELVRRATRRTFGFWERHGLHVTPTTDDQPLPDSRRIPEGLWPDAGPVPGVELDEEAQLAVLQEVVRHRGEYEALALHGTAEHPDRFHLYNGFFGPVDAEVYFATLRDLRPARLVEVGSGYSTLLALEALRRNRAEGGPDTILVAIEPYPNDVLARGIDGLDLVRSPVQDVPLSVFEELEAGDVLFLDSSHVLRTGSDVHYELLEVVPRLAPGVHVHVHDIFLPFEYPRDWVTRARRFWNEQYLLQAFLAFNDCCHVRWTSHLMHRRHAAALQAAFPSFRPDLDVPSSLWMVRTA